jgi:hypothetical protein
MTTAEFALPITNAGPSTSTMKALVYARSMYSHRRHGGWILGYTIDECRPGPR